MSKCFVSRLPAIVDQLRPARAILNDLNREVRIQVWEVDEDGVTSEVFLRHSKKEIPNCMYGLVKDLFYTAFDLLPEGYSIKVEGDEFVIYRLTDEEVASQNAYMEEICRREGEPKGESIHWPFRIEAEAKVAFDQTGNAVPFFGCVHPWFSDRSTPADRAERLGKQLEHVAGLCCIDQQYIVPISTDDYKAAGFSLDGAKPMTDAAREHGIAAWRFGPPDDCHDVVAAASLEEAQVWYQKATGLAPSEIQEIAQVGNLDSFRITDMEDVTGMTAAGDKIYCVNTARQVIQQSTSFPVIISSTEY